MVRLVFMLGVKSMEKKKEEKKDNAFFYRSCD